MKKRLIGYTAAALGVVLACSKAGAASGNAAGYVQIDIPPAGQLVLAALNFEKVGGDSKTLREVFGTNVLRQANNALSSTTADRIIMWDWATQNYQTYFQTTNGNFYKIGAGATVQNPAVTVGTGFWLKAPNGAATTKSIFLDGQAPVTAPLTSLNAGLNMLGYASAGDVDLALIDWKNSALGVTGSAFSSGVCDKIIVYNPVTSGYTTYYFNQNKVLRNLNGTALPHLVLPAGCAIWYKAVGSVQFRFSIPWS